jgi:hypothetical protein
MAGAVIEVVAFLIFAVLLGVGAVALGRATRAARRPPTNVDPWSDGIRYTDLGFLANLIARGPVNRAEPTSSGPAEEGRPAEPR